MTNAPLYCVTKTSQKDCSTVTASCEDAKAQKLGISCVWLDKCHPLALM